MNERKEQGKVASNRKEARRPEHTFDSEVQIMFIASAQKGDGAPMRVTRQQIEALPALYRALAEVCLEQNTGDLILVEERI